MSAQSGAGPGRRRGVFVLGLVLLLQGPAALTTLQGRAVLLALVLPVLYVVDRALAASWCSLGPSGPCGRDQHARALRRPGGLQRHRGGAGQPPPADRPGPERRPGPRAAPGRPRARRPRRDRRLWRPGRPGLRARGRAPGWRPSPARSCAGPGSSRRRGWRRARCGSSWGTTGAERRPASPCPADVPRPARASAASRTRPGVAVVEPAHPRGVRGRAGAPSHSQRRRTTPCFVPPLAAPSGAPAAPPPSRSPRPPSRSPAAPRPHPRSRTPVPRPASPAPASPTTP